MEGKKEKKKEKQQQQQQLPPPQQLRKGSRVGVKTCLCLKPLVFSLLFLLYCTKFSIRETIYVCGCH